MTNPLPANWADGKQFTAAAENLVETTLNTVYGLAVTQTANNNDGTVTVNNLPALQPLTPVVIYTSNTAPAIGAVTYYNATSGNLTPPLPALSGLRVGARLGVRRDPADVSQNTVTLSCAGSDTFYSSSATTATLPLSGEQREYQVISVSGTKYWAPSGALNSVAALDNRYLAGASKLVSIGDQGFGARTNALPTSTAGTSEMMFKVGAAASEISAAWDHFYSGGNPTVDSDPSGSISFNASLRVVSSTNPGTVTNTIYRLTFNGRTTATIDPGGRVTSDPLGMSLAAGDVVAVRTFLSSGTAYANRTIYGSISGVVGGFVATTDLTAPGSAAISASQGNYYGPSLLMGRAQNATSAKSVLLLGDSILAGTGDGGSIYSATTIAPGGFGIRALSGIAGLTKAAIAGDAATYFQGTNGSFRRLNNALGCNSAIIQYGVNDLANAGATASSLEGILLNLAANIRRLGISKVFLTTLLPYTTSTDAWATVGNQTVFSIESNRVTHNTWVRAGCPINPTTLAAVAVGTPGAMTVGQFGHPITGFFDTAAQVESSLNSGFWLPASRITTGSMTASSTITTSSAANFQSATQETGGDLGSGFVLAGAGASGAYLTNTNIAIVSSSTQIYGTVAAATTVTNTQLAIGVKTVDGLHPSSNGHVLVAQAINPAML